MAMPEETKPRPRESQEFASDPLRLTTAIASMVGLVMMIFAGILALLYSPSTMFFAPYWLSGVGLLAIIFFVFFNFEWLRQVITGRAALSGVLVGVMCTAAAAIWFGGNYLFNYPARNKLAKMIGIDPLYRVADLTKMRKFTLDEKTAAVIEDLEHPLELKVMWRASPQEGPQLDDLLGLYAEASDKITLEFLMPGTEDYERKRRRLAERLDMELGDIQGRSISMFYGKRSKHITYPELWEERPVPMYGRVGQQRIFKGEEAITSAIFEMTDPKEVKVYFVVDHGERSPENPSTGMNAAGKLLKRSSIDWATMDLRTKKEIPGDASLVAICGPRRTITEEELKVLERYVIERKGRLLICLDDYRPDVRLGLDGLLARFGLQAGMDYVIERNNDYQWGRYRDIFIGKDLGHEPRAMLDKLRENRIEPSFRSSRSVGRLEGYRGPFSPTELCSGSADSYGETDVQALYKGKFEFDKNSDTEGPIHYAMASWEGPPPMWGGRMDKKLGRVVVFGDSDWCNDTLIRLPDNRTFFMAVVNWLVGREKSIHIEAKLADDETYILKPRPERVFKIVLITIPVLLFLGAVLVFWVRRR
jgi:ABC-2 type transport system permease protein